MHNGEGSGCARCGSTDGELYKWTYVSINADEVVRLCQPCFRHVLDRQRQAVKENMSVLQSASGSQAGNKKENWWMTVGGMVAAAAMIAFVAWILFGAFAPSQGPSLVPIGPYVPQNP